MRTDRARVICVDSYKKVDKADRVGQISWQQLQWQADPEGSTRIWQHKDKVEKNETCFNTIHLSWQQFY